MKQFQIHIGGAKRSGKSTLARNILSGLREKGCRPVIIDVDVVKRRIFGDEAVQSALPDTTRSLEMQRNALSVIFSFIIQAVLETGGTPIVTATHSDNVLYYTGQAVAKFCNVPFRFLLVEAINITEAARRARKAASDDSDMMDFDDKAIRKSFMRSVSRIRENYGADFKEPHLRVPQGTPEKMADRALRFIFQ